MPIGLIAIAALAVIVLLIITFIPQSVLFLPKMFGLM